jgi:hypothetical protein
MAILKKRTSSRKLPEARGIERAPLSSVIGGASPASRPEATVSKPAISTATSPSITTQTSSAPKQTLTSSTSSAPKTTPAVSTAKPVTSITTPTPAAKTSIKPGSTKPNATVNAITNAISGAALGAGTKLVVDKLTGKPVAKPVVNPAAPKAEIVGKGNPSDYGGGPATSVVKPPVDTKPVYETPLAPGGGAPYDDAGKLMPGWQLDENNNPVWIGVDEVQSKVGALNPNEVSALTPETSFEPEYFQDSLGNIYVSTADGGYDLYRSAETENTWTDPETGDIWALDSSGEWNFQTAGNQGEGQNFANAEPLTWQDPDSGAMWTLGEDGSWTTDWTDSNIDNTQYAVNEEDPLLYEEAKSGGLITMMKNGGGVKGYAIGGYTYNKDGSFTVEYGNRLDTHDAQGRFLYSTPIETSPPMPQSNQSNQAIDNGDGTYTIGRFTYDSATDEYLYSSDNGVITNVNPDAVSSPTSQEPYYSTDSLGNIFKNGEFYRAAEVPEDITSAGSGGRNWYDDLGNTLSKGATGAVNLGKGALEGITNALGTTAGAAGAGALVATLLGSDFGGGGTQNEGLDMSKVGVINPRTTNFGVGPANFVGYDQYGTGGGDYTPNAELLKNLNAPGYNPVNEGDYGYAEPAPKMASGGLSSMSSPVASYYTFGQPADIMANLGMRPQPPMNPPDMMAQVGQQQPAQQAQQQRLPQQSPPLAQQQMSPTMPQQGVPQNGMMPQGQNMAPPMRKGGLPHFSDVPMVEGRMDFRNGSAVHGEGDGQSDDIPAMLADGEYVLDAELVSQIGNGSTKAGAQALDKFRENIRAHKRSAPLNKIPPKTKALTSYLKGAK